MFVHATFLYYVDRDSRTLERVDKLTGSDPKRVLSRPSGSNASFTDVLVVSRATGWEDALLRTPCGHDNGGCSHLCVVRYGELSAAAAGGEGDTQMSSSDGAERRGDDALRRCSCPVGLMLTNNERTCSTPPTCEPDSFACVSAVSVCIPVSWRCDGSNDCVDESDEQNCTVCTQAQFRCKSGHCMPSKVRCDGKLQCDDGTDEDDCPPCPANARECSVDQMCILQSRWCDGKEDCPSGDDEITGCKKVSVGVLTGGHSTSTPYAIGISIVGGIIAVVVLLILVMCVCQRKTRQFAVVEGRDDIVMVVQPSCGGESQLGCGGGTESRRGSLLSAVVTTTEGGCDRMPLQSSSRIDVTSLDSESLLYDRDNITGASSSTSSAVTTCAYPKETLNPPPSPMTDRSPSVVAPRAVCSTVGHQAAAKKRLYKRRRKQHRHPTTPCSTDVCEDSEVGFYPPTGGQYGGGWTIRRDDALPPVSTLYHPAKRDRYLYESDPLCPPPTPHSQYLSEEPSCPPSPSTERSFFISYPPPPPSSVLSGASS